MKQLFVSLRWQSVVDFFVQAAVIYGLLLWGSRNRLLRVVAGIGGLVLLGNLAQRMDLPSRAALALAGALAAGLLLVHQAEIRYALLQLDPFSRWLRPAQIRQPSVLKALAQVAFALAETNRGAWLVLTGKQSMKYASEKASPKDR